VVFQKLSPHESFFLPSTTKVETFTVQNNKNVKFTVNDFPGDKQFDAVTDRALLEKTGAIIYVFDAQIGDLEESCSKLKEVIQEARKVKDDIFYEVFIHKVDSDMYQNDDQRRDVYHDFQREIMQELNNNEINVNISFYLTSIYDHTIFDSLSKIVQKLFPFVEHLVAMLDSLHSS
jgi:Ras-related GTP-binding protein C/D